MHGRSLFIAGERNLFLSENSSKRRKIGDLVAKRERRQVVGIIRWTNNVCTLWRNLVAGGVGEMTGGNPISYNPSIKDSSSSSIVYSGIRIMQLLPLFHIAAPHFCTSYPCIGGSCPLRKSPRGV